MKITEHVEHLLRQRRKPKELIELGFPKRVVTRVRRQLREEETVPRSRTQKGGVEVTPPVEMTDVQPSLESLEGKVQLLEKYTVTYKVGISCAIFYRRSPRHSH